MMGRTRRASSALTAATLVVLSSVIVACRPLYVPLVPDAPAEPRFVVMGADSAMIWSAASNLLELRIVVMGIAEPGWLAVQWLRPGGAEAASVSLWLDPAEGEAGADGTVTRVVLSPADLELSPGEWRAVVSWQGVLLRQLRAEVLATPEE